MNKQTQSQERNETHALFTRIWENLEGGWPGGFRQRCSQREMSKQACDVFTDGGIALIEAPTGTGKSLAYLAAGISSMKATNRSLVIATATIALQEQLVNRDIPSFLAAAGIQATVAIAKGRSHYFCPRNAKRTLDAARDQGNRGSADLVQVRALLGDFERKTWSGDMDAPLISVPDRVKKHVTTTRFECSGKGCAFWDTCPAVVAREQVLGANVVVTNHRYLLADRLLENREFGGWGGVILPAPWESLLVIDEAHELAETARSHEEVWVTLGNSSIRSLADLLTQLGAPDIAADFKGAASEFEREHCEPRRTQPSIDLYREVAGRGPTCARGDARKIYGLAQRALIFVRDRITKDVHENVRERLGKAQEIMERHVSLWEMWADVRDPDLKPTALWLDWKDGHNVHVCAAPVDGSAILRDLLWRQHGATVLTSATLSAGGCLDPMMESLGLDAGTTYTSILESPYDLANLGVIQVPSLGVDPTDGNDHCLAIARWLAASLDWRRGSLVLFTAKWRLDGVLNRLPSSYRALVLAQGTQLRSELLASHTSRINAGHGSVLFGLASFGAGMDLPGRLCETVVIAGIPFVPPTEPVFAAHSDWLRDRGDSGFAALQLPRAKRLLAQWAGRLVRSETDRGRVVILDDRILTKRYGSDLLAALPPFPRQLGNPVGTALAAQPAPRPQSFMPRRADLQAQLGWATSFRF